MTSKTKPTANAKATINASVAADSFTWSNPLGGGWSTAGNWTDTTTSAIATIAPGAASAVTVAGGVGDFTNITGIGAAAQLTVSNNVLFWGPVTVAGAVSLTQAADLELDGAALTGGSLSTGFGATLAVGDASTLRVSGAANLSSGSFLLATAASTAQFGSLVADTAVIAVDDNSSIEVGSLGGAALGAITIDNGQSAAISGALDGNVVVNGTLGVQAGSSLTIDFQDPYGNGQAISGAGTLVLSENSSLSLAVADSAAIQFAGPHGGLSLGVLPTGAISGFTNGDVIDLFGGLATGLTYQQTTPTLATLTLTKGGKPVGTLTLAGNYANSRFHLGPNGVGNAKITLQTIGSAPTPPTLIAGTIGTDRLIATAINQTLTGLGGHDSLDTNGFTGIDFKDTTVNLDGSTINNFGVTDLIDLTDMKLATASASYAGGVLTVTDGTHSTALQVTGTLPIGFFAASPDGATGAEFKYVAVNTDADSFNAPLGGSFATAGNWSDLTTGVTATAAPSFGNDVTIAQLAAGATNVTGNGAAASLTTIGNVLLWGGLAVGGTVSGVSGRLTQGGTLALDGAASLVLAGGATIDGLLQVGGGSKLTAAGDLFLNNGETLLAFGGSTVRFGSINFNRFPGDLVGRVIAVDATSSVEIGTTGTASKGALTIDSGTFADGIQTVNGNIVVNGTLAGNNMVIGRFGTTAPSISGTGTLQIGAGGSLTLAGSDSAAIAFDHFQFGFSSDTLALNGSLPTGTISGFGVGDTIAVAPTVTSLSYVQTTPVSGTLTLHNGSAAVGTLALGGSYSAGQFQIKTSFSGQGSAISYSPAPSTAPGNQLSNNADSFSWTNLGGGVWSNPANWSDNGSPAASAPSAGNFVTIAVPINGGSAVIVSGSGAAASLGVFSATAFTGSVTIAGDFNVNATTYIDPGASVTAGSLDGNGPLLVSGGRVAVNGATGVTGTVGVVGGGRLTTASLSIGGTLAVDATSAIECGTTGGAAIGALTVDSGIVATMGIAVGGAFGSVSPSNIFGNVVLNGGTISVSDIDESPFAPLKNNSTIGGFSSGVGSITGTGIISISGGHLVLLEAASVAISLNTHPGSIFSPLPDYPMLELAGPLPTGVISGFVAGDIIRVDQAVTSVSFVQTTPTQGTLTLLKGAATLGTLALGGNFAGNLFHVDVAAATGTAAITLQAAPAAAGTAAASTGTDGYSWTGSSGGVWSNAANWFDTTTNTLPNTAVPGSGNAVTIAGTVNAYTTVGGNGAAASLAISGNVLMTGTIAVAKQLAVNTTAMQLALESGAKLTAGSALLVGALQVGHAASATVTGTATLSGGGLLALGGGTAQVGGLIGNGGGNVIAIDANSIVKIGAPNVAVAGALTQQTGTTAALTGAIYGSVVANGTLSVAAGGSLAIDMTGAVESDPYGVAPTIGGAGTLSLSEGSTLALGVASTAAIAFAGPNATLQLAAIPTATITGFTVGDVIAVDRTVTGLSFAQTTSTSATISLTNGGVAAGTLKLAGNYAGLSFHLAVDPSGASATISLQSIGVAATQPTLIQGTAAADHLQATANAQTITGLGGGDTINGNAFTGLILKDLTANLSGSAVQSFATSDLIDFTNMTSANASASYTGGVLSVTDGTHAATLTLGFLGTPAIGSFGVASDGATGTKVFWH
jgi:hypothetical protein